MPIQRYWILTARKLNGEVYSRNCRSWRLYLRSRRREQRTAAALEQVWQQEAPGLSVTERTATAGIAGNPYSGTGGGAIRGHLSPGADTGPGLGTDFADRHRIFFLCPSS